MIISHGDVSLEECIIIARAITEENKKKPHMIPEKPENLYMAAKNHGCMTARRKIDSQIAGFIKLSLLHSSLEIYERGSLMVLSEYRGAGIGGRLIRAITEVYARRSILAITTEDSVAKVNRNHSNFQQELLRDKIPKRLLAIIEGPQLLEDGEHVFINHQLDKRIRNGEFS